MTLLLRPRHPLRQEQLQTLAAPSAPIRRRRPRPPARQLRDSSPFELLSARFCVVARARVGRSSVPSGI